MVDNLVMPEKVSVGFKGGPTFSTDKVKSVSQQTRRLMNQPIAVHTYTWNLQNADNEASSAIVDQLRSFWFDRRGDFKTFLMKDWADFKLVAEQIFIGDGIANSCQVTKTYTAGVNPYVRVIRHIKAGTLQVFRDGVPQTTSGDWTVNSTGLITFPGILPIDTIITVNCEFYVPVNFEGDAFTAALPEQNTDIVSVDGLQAIEDIP
jgi:uncharacterized protein (TIGR02217 family)